VCRFARETSVKEVEEGTLRGEHFNMEKFNVESYYVLKKFIFGTV
jgi:hypothetical protein